MNYALGYTFNLEDLFFKFNINKIKIDYISLKRLYGVYDKRIIAQRVFKDCCKLVIADIINNDVEFQLPTSSRKSSILMYRTKDEEFKQARRNGAYKDVDFLESGFSGYSLRFYMYGYNTISRYKPIHLNKELKELITKYTNEGKVYSGINIKTFKDYIRPLKQLYPWIPTSDIVKILNYGWRSLYIHNSYGCDTLVSDSNFWFYTGWLTPNSIKHFNYYATKLSIKLRILYIRNKVEWDGFYYFGLSYKQYQDYILQKNSRGRKRKYFVFNKIKCFKFRKECEVSSHSCPYIFRVCLSSDFGYDYYINRLKTNKAELIITRKPLTFKDILVTNNDYEIL